MTRAVFRAVLPLPTSVNNSLRPAKLGDKGGTRLVKTREAESFEATARAALRSLSPPLALHRGPVELYLTVYVPSLAADGGNRLKLLEDALKGLALHDDRQLVEWHVVKRIDAKRPRVELVLQHADVAEHQDVAERLARAERELGPPAYYEPKAERAKARAAKKRAGLKLSTAYKPHRP
jgi:Holliday junction resolvase RusA-like endonuclease